VARDAVDTRTPARIHRLRAPAIAAVAAAALLTPLLTAAPASAATSGVTTPLELGAAFADANIDTVRLDADVDATDPVTPTVHTFTLDLNGHTLQTGNLLVTPGTTLTVVDSGTGGTLRADARTVASSTAGITTTDATLDIRAGTIDAYGEQGGAGIGGDLAQNGGTLRISGGTVTANGGIGAAGIGGGAGGRAGWITISGGTITANGGMDAPGIGNGETYLGDASAVVDIEGGTVAAHGGQYGFGAPGVGGGSHSSGVTLTVGAAATLTVSDEEGKRGFGGDIVYSSAWGSYTISGTLVLGNNVVIPEGHGITVLPGGVVRGTGSFQKDPTPYGGFAPYIDNYGALQVGVDPLVRVYGNNFMVSYAANHDDATVIWPPYVRIYAASLADAGRSLPPLPTAIGGFAWGWNTAANGQGTPVTDSTTITGNLTVYADWRFLNAAWIDVDDDTITAGETIELQVIGHEAFADVDSDQTASASFASDVESDVVTDTSIRMTQAGTHTITATIAGFGTVSRQIEVLAGPLDHVTAQLYEQDGTGRGDAIGSGTAATVTAGTPLMLIAGGWDAYDNLISELPAAVASTGPETVTGQTFTPTSAASRTITATASGHSTSIALTVLPSDTVRAVITVPSPITAGGTSTVGVVGFDAYDNETDLSSQASVTSSVAGDAIAGNAITATLAGTRTISATVPGLAPVQSTLQVDAGPLASITVDASAASVVAGNALGFTAHGQDVYGNPTGDATGLVTFSTDSPGAVVTGDTIQFFAARGAAVTATLNLDHTVTSSTTVEVTPGALASLTVTPADMTLTAGESTTFAVHGVDAWGNPVVITDAVTLTSDDATDAVTGDAIAFTTAGDHRVTATLDDAAATSASTTVSVAAAPASAITLEATTTSVRQGGCLSFAVSGTDAFGNPIERIEGASLSSDQPTDLVDGLTVCFPHASPHRITAHLGTMSSVLLVEVVPSLALTGDELTPTLALAALLALLAGLALVARRRMRA
jgi:LPXTG-motif cell wall-anchored protein